MSRRFDREIIPTDSGLITMNPGAAPVGGPLSFAVVFRVDSVAADQDLVRADTAAASLVWALNQSGGQLFWSMNGAFKTCDAIAANTWYLFVVTKDAGSVQLRSHLCDMATDTWTHTDRGLMSDPTGPIDRVYLGWTGGGAHLNGYIAAMGAAPSHLDDAAVQALRPGLSAWLAAGMAPLWRLNDTPVADLSGGSGSQSAILGTTVNTAIEPPGFDYSTETATEPEPEPQPEDQREGSWQQWIDAIRTGAQEYHLYKDRERDNPVECPNDGEPLQMGPDGALYCRYDGWRPHGVGTPSDN